MRSILLFACLCLSMTAIGQGSGFTFNYSGPTQIMVGQNCMATLNWGHPNTPTVTSNIPGGVIVYFDIFSISGGYVIGDPVMGGTTVTVFYQAVDNFGNNALFGFSIVFVDVIAPTFDPLSLPPNITVSCSSNLPPPANVEAMDNCADEDPPLTITYTQTGNVAPCAAGTIQRKWVADDDLGNTAQFVQTITVQADNTPPVIANTLQNGMAPCSTAMAQYTTWLNTQRANFMATDNGCGVMTLSDNAPSPATITSFCGVVEVTFTAKDNCNNTSTAVKTFTVTNNVPPVITNPASGASGNCGQANIAQVFNNWIATHGGATATDDCSSIFWSTYPPHPALGDTCDAAIVVMFIAGDGCNNFDTTTASFILLDETPPAITMEPTTMVLSCTTTGLDSILLDWLTTGGHSKAHDLCTPDNDLVLGYQIDNNPLTLDEVLEAWEDSLASGCRDGVFINGIGINNVKGLLEIRFTYADHCDNLGGAVGYFGITDNGRPVFDTLPSDLSYACSANQDWMDAFTDWYNSAGHADYSDQCSEVTVHASITADSAIALLSAALDTSCMGGVGVTIQFSLTDECGNVSSATPSATFSLGDTLAPVLTTPAGDFLVACSPTVQTQLQSWLDTNGGAVATDGCSGLEWTFTWADTSGTLHTGIPGQGPYPQAGFLGCSEALDVFFTVKDICQNATSDTASFMVMDTSAPVINIAADTLYISCQDTLPDLGITITDVCDAAPVIVYSDSVSTDSCTGHPAFLFRTITATDACGNSSTAMIAVFSIDTIPPTFDLPPDTIRFCGVDTLALLNVADNCDPSPAVTFTDQTTGPDCHQTLTRTWTVTDACGNSATAEQQFDLSDDAPPLIVTSPGNFVFGCDTTAASLQDAYETWLNQVAISDACSASNWFIAVPGSYTVDDTMTWPGTPLPDSIMLMCGDVMMVSGDLVVYDACENVLVQNISFTVNDTTPPVFLSCTDRMVIPPDSNCAATVTLSAPAVEEICFPDDVKLLLVIDGGDTLSLDTITSIDTLLPVGIHEIVWLASDCMGNTGVCETSLEIIDEDALTIFCPTDTLLYTTSGSCSSMLTVHAPQTLIAGCGLGAEVWGGFVEGKGDPSSFTFDSADDSLDISFSAGINFVFLFAQDSTGDIDTCRFVVEVRDTFPPELHCQSDTVFVSASGVDTIFLENTNLLLSAIDGCGMDTIIYAPSFVTCGQAGQDIAVTITATDQNGNTAQCFSMLTVQMEVLQPSGGKGLCDDTLRLFSNILPDTTASYMFTWAGPNGFMSSEENPAIPNSDSTYTGTYTLTVEGSNGCTASGSVDVFVLEIITPVVGLTADTLCPGDPVELSTTFFTGATSFNWYLELPGGDSLLATTVNPEFDWLPPGPGAFGFYAIIGADSCSSDPGPVTTLYVLASPTADIAVLPDYLCVTDSLFLMPESVIDSLSYLWTGPNGYQSMASSPPAVAATDLDSVSLFTLTVSNALCTSTPDSATVHVQPVPATPVITGDTLACEQGTITLYANPAGDTYSWISPQLDVTDINIDSLVITPVSMNDEGEWKVISYLHGCPSDTSAGFIVNVDTAITIEIVTTTITCEGDSITLSVSPQGMGTYTWSGPNGFSSDLPSPVVLAENGTYSVTVMTTTGCDASDDVDVTVNETPIILDLVIDADSCVTGTSPVSVFAVTDPGFTPSLTYHWTGPAAFMEADSSIVFDSATSAINGQYTVYVLNGLCSSDTASIDVVLFDSPVIPVITGNNVYCFGDTIFLFIDSPLPGAGYSWTSNDTSVVVASPGTLVIPNASLNNSGIYHVSVNQGGCASGEATIAIQVKAALAAPLITGPSSICDDASLQLTASVPSGAVVHWSGPNGFASDENPVVIFPVTSDAAGDYTAYFELNGCASPVSQPFAVSVQTAITSPSLITDVTALCIDENIPVTLCVDPVSSIAGATYTWILNGNTVLGSSVDSCIVLTDSPWQDGMNAITLLATLDACVSDTSAVTNIQGNEAPNLMANAGPPDRYCPDENIQLSGSSPLPGTGMWSSSDPVVIFDDPTDPNTHLLALPSGEYTITWTLSYETCTDYDADSVVISVITPPIAIVDSVSVPFGQTGEFVVTLNDIISNEPYTLSIASPPQRGNALHIGNGIFRYTPNVGFVGTDVMIYRLCSTDCPDECTEAMVYIKVGDETDCFVPTLFTPNGDGVNDVLTIPCLESSLYPKNRITVFNEWGDAVFTASPYQNNWEGKLSGDDLPVGTYFYIMDFGDGSKPKRTFLVLER